MFKKDTIRAHSSSYIPHILLSIDINTNIINTANIHNFSNNNTTSHYESKTFTKSPSVSSSPTDTCYWVDIVVVFDDYPEETSWDIQTINDPGDNVVLKTFNGTSEANKLQSESMCLKVGEYQFTIYDEYGDGIEAPGHYNVTSEGNLIVKGGQFGHSESTIFSIPYEPPVVLVLDISAATRNRRRSHTDTEPLR